MVSSDAAERLAELRVTTGLRMPDCCVVIAAHDGGARLATLDRRLGRRAAAVGVATVDR